MFTTTLESGKWFFINAPAEIDPASVTSSVKPCGACLRPKKKETSIDLAFVANCAKLLVALELEKLEPSQSQSLSIDLDSLRLEIDAKLSQLVGRLSSGKERYKKLDRRDLLLQSK